MTEQERLEELKEKWDWNRANPLEDMSIDELSWLIQQAEEKIKLEERVKELEKEKEELKQSLSLMAYTTDEIILHSEAKDEVIRNYSQALEFYADKHNYELWEKAEVGDEYIHSVDFDCGKKARQALEGETNG